VGKKTRGRVTARAPSFKPYPRTMNCQWKNQLTALQKALETCELENTETLSRIECCFVASSTAAMALV
jgi:hypothetical protein